MVEKKINLKLFGIILLILISTIFLFKFNLLAWVGAVTGTGESSIGFIWAGKTTNPEIVTLPDLTYEVTVGETVSFTAVFNDSDGDDLTVTDSEGWFTIATTKSGIETTADFLLVTDNSHIGTHLITIAADDGHYGTGKVSFNITLTVNPLSGTTPTGGGIRCIPKIFCDECEAGVQLCQDGCGRSWYEHCEYEGGCDTDDDCPPFYRCDKPKCVFTGDCLDDSHCDVGFVCVNYQCVSLPLEELPYVPPRGHPLGFREQFLQMPLISWPKDNIIDPLVKSIFEAGPVTKGFIGAANLLVWLLLMYLLIKVVKKEIGKSKNKKE